MHPTGFSSCRGVSCEVRPSTNNPFVVPESLPEEDGKRAWLPWNPWRTSFEVFPVPEGIQRSASRQSSHFCDLTDDEETEDDVEKQKHADASEEPLHQELELQEPSKREAVSGAAKPPQPSPDSRLAMILLDQGLFTVYKRLFIVCLTLNAVGLVLAATGHFPYGRQKAALFAVGNILALVFCRSEAFLRVVFWLAVKLLGHGWVPIRIKTMTTSLLQSLGGIHSGCGVSSLAWLVYALVLTLEDRDNTSDEIIAIASAILSLLLLSCLAAFPLVRHLHHNVFERIHRFAGWTSLALLWAFVILTISYDPTAKAYDVRGSGLVQHQEFWFTTAITILIILPWVTVRRVPVTITAPSGHASIIKFDGGVPAGILGRISPSPLSEWHAFGIISDGKREHMILAGAVGDFTKSLVAGKPKHLWVRSLHFAGLPYLVNMYQRVVVVATGSGICVFLSFLLQPCKADVCVVWVANGIEQNFGKEIKEWMSGHPKEKVIIHDTALLGRPNVAEMSIDAAKRWKAEVVIVTSNPQGSRDVVNACKDAGIPSFGPIWDS